MYVCMDMYILIYIYIHMQVYICICIYVYIYICTHMLMHTQVFAMQALNRYLFHSSYFTFHDLHLSSLYVQAFWCISYSFTYLYLQVVTIYIYMYIYVEQTAIDNLLSMDQDFPHRNTPRTFLFIQLNSFFRISFKQAMVFQIVRYVFIIIHH